MRAGLGMAFGLAMLAAAGSTLADDASPVDAGDRVDRRFDLDRRAGRADRHGHELLAQRLDSKDDRIDHRLDRRGDRFDRRWDRRH